MAMEIKTRWTYAQIKVNYLDHLRRTPFETWTLQEFEASYNEYLDNNYAGDIRELPYATDEQHEAWRAECAVEDAKREAMMQGLGV
jgi:hypothetical protein